MADIKKVATRVSYGEELVALGAERDDFVVLDADLAAATQTGKFKAAHPERFYDVGIAEANMVGIAAGIATTGKKVFCSTFAMFAAGRAFEQNDPEYVLILSGDQLYRMDYAEMLETHKKNNADLTIAVMPVPWEEASRFGIITTDEEGRITKFTEKPKKPDSNLASMGIYIFTTDLLLAALREDAVDQTSEHDFGKNIIPKLLEDGKRLYTYEFNGFWRDVGTISSYHETSMDLLGPNPAFDIFDEKFPIMSNASTRPPSFVGRNGEVEDCLVSNGCRILGKAKHSIISTDAVIGERATVVDSVLLPGAVVKDGAHVVRAILGENAVVEENVNLGSVDATKDTAVIGNDVVVGKGEN